MSLLGLFSVVVLLAHQLRPQDDWHLRQSTSYATSHAMFVDALALVRCYLWKARLFDSSS
jgi:hypothetical protein